MEVLAAARVRPASSRPRRRPRATPRPSRSPAPDVVEHRTGTLAEIGAGTAFVPGDRDAAAGWSSTEVAHLVKVPAEAELDAPVAGHRPRRGRSHHRRARRRRDRPPRQGARRALPPGRRRAPRQRRGPRRRRLRRHGRVAAGVGRRRRPRRSARRARRTRRPGPPHRRHPGRQGRPDLGEPRLRGPRRRRAPRWASTSPGPASTASTASSSTTRPSNCKSYVEYKGALQGQGAHAVWIGDVLIRATAEGTETYELNRNLVLTDGARADSVPNLEIETGEIVGAGHASRHRPLRRRAAVLPAVARHHRGRGPPAGGARLLRRASSTRSGSPRSRSDS